VIYVADFEMQKIWRPRKINTLPAILSVQEVDRLLHATNNVKHACLMYAIYSTGMRLREILALRLQDCIWDRNQVYIRNSKGNKDRVVMFSKLLKAVMIKYIELYKPEYWLFEGQDKKKQYSRQSVQKVIKKAAANAGITRNVTTHMLRHCFATHLMDNGTDLRYPRIAGTQGHQDHADIHSRHYPQCNQHSKSTGYQVCKHESFEK
jgi:site-specific recombinase XerD